MSSIKLHAFIGNDNGTVSCDYRGEKFIGSENDPRRTTGEIDQHRTVLERDPATEQEIAAVLEFGPKLNKILQAMDPAEAIKGLVGKENGFRIGVWDE